MANFKVIFLEKLDKETMGNLRKERWPLGQDSGSGYRDGETRNTNGNFGRTRTGGGSNFLRITSSGALC